MDSDSELLVSPAEAARRLSVGRTRLFQLLASGELASVQVGKLRRIPTQALRDYVDGLVAVQRGARGIHPSTSRQPSGGA
jgi:excisionase family DNA binding protein